MGGSHLAMQISNILQVGATAASWGQGYVKVIPYIWPDPYILCPKYQRFISNGFDMSGKSLSLCSSGRDGGRGGNEPKT